MVDLHLVCAPIRSGKTTALAAWAKSRPVGTVAGVLAPDRPDGRYIVDVSSGEARKLTADPDVPDHDAVAIGRYRFNRNTFAWARHLLDTGFAKRPVWLIFDEIGYLELRGAGLEPMVRDLLNANRAERQTELIWVVRNELLHDVVQHYGIAEWRPLEGL